MDRLNSGWQAPAAVYPRQPQCHHALLPVTATPLEWSELRGPETTMSYNSWLLLSIHSKDGVVCLCVCVCVFVMSRRGATHSCGEVLRRGAAAARAGQCSPSVWAWGGQGRGAACRPRRTLAPTAWAWRRRCWRWTTQPAPTHRPPRAAASPPPAENHSIHINSFTQHTRK